MPKKRSGSQQENSATPPAKLQDRFGCNLKLIRSQLGLTQRGLAAVSGIAQTEISKIERGRINLTLATMERLAKVVDRDVTSLLGETPAPPTKK